MTYVRICLASFLIIVLISSCEDHKVSKKTGTVEFTFSEVITSSGGRLKQDISSILISIRGASGDMIHERKKISLFQFDGQYLSEPIALNVGNYTLTEFIVLNENGTAIYASPLEGSPLAHIVDDPLPMSFSVATESVTKITPQVIEIEGNTSSDFGYTTFGLEIIKTFSFDVGVFIYNSSVKNFALTSAHMKVTSSTQTLFDKDLSAATNTIRIRDNLETYSITVTKAGYGTYERTFTLQELKELTAPLVITLLAESLSDGLVAYYPFNGNANDETANDLNGIVNGAELTTDKDGHAEAAYAFDGTDDNIRVPHNNLLNLDGDHTISLWANISSGQEPHNGINDILRKWNGDAQGYPFSISYLNPLADDLFEDRILHSRYDGQVCDNSVASHSPLITNDTFVHIVLVKDDNKIRTYLNNVLTEEVEDPTTCSTANDADMTIGSRGNQVRFFKGTIDDIRIYDRALTEDEIGNLNGE